MRRSIFSGLLASFLSTLTTCQTTPKLLIKNDQIAVYTTFNYQIIEFNNQETYSINKIVYNQYEKSRHLIPPPYQIALQDPIIIKKVLSIIDDDDDKTITIKEALATYFSQEKIDKLEKILDEQCRVIAVKNQSSQPK